MKKRIREICALMAVFMVMPWAAAPPVLAYGQNKGAGEGEWITAAASPSELRQAELGEWRTEEEIWEEAATPRKCPGRFYMMSRKPFLGITENRKKITCLIPLQEEIKSSTGEFTAGWRKRNWQAGIHAAAQERWNQMRSSYLQTTSTKAWRHIYTGTFGRGKGVSGTGGQTWHGFSGKQN